MFQCGPVAVRDVVCWSVALVGCGSVAPWPCGGEGCGPVAVWIRDPVAVFDCSPASVAGISSPWLYGHSHRQTSAWGRGEDQGVYEVY